jgi:hypothetical protein
MNINKILNKFILKSDFTIKVLFNGFSHTVFQINTISIILKFIGTLSKSAQIKIDSSVKTGDLKSYKKHEGKHVIKKIVLPEELEERINIVMSGK